MKKFLLTTVFLLTTMSSWAIQEMETHHKVHNIGGVWYQIVNGEAWVSSRWHYGYEYDPGKFLEIKDWDSYSGDVMIPETIVWSETDNVDTPQVEGDGMTIPVVGIMEKAFDYSQGLTSVSIPKSVKYIESFAFQSCPLLKEIIIPNTVDSIGEGPFEYCETLSKVTFEDGENVLKWKGIVYNSGPTSAMTEIYMGRPYNQMPEGFHPFRSLRVKKLTFGDAVEEIYEEDAAYNDALETVVLGKGIKRIGKRAFDTNYNLTSVTLNEGITEIDDLAFNFCSALTSITLPSTLKRLGGSVFASTNISSLTIPASVEYVGGNLCDYCEKLRKVTIEDGETLLQWNGLNLIAVDEVYVGRPYQTPEGVSAFGAINTKKIVFGDAVEQIYADDVTCGENLETVVLGKGIKNIAGSAFSWDTNVKEVYVTATTPPVVDGESLGNIDLETCKLYVPEESLNDYMEAAVWKDFLNIEGSSFSGVTDAKLAPATGCYYTLGGQRISKPSRSGIYINNGKIFLKQ